MDTTNCNGNGAADDWKDDTASAGKNTTTSTAANTASNSKDSPKEQKQLANNNDNDNNNGNNNNKKRKREKVNHYVNAYEKVRFEPILAVPQPIAIAGVDRTIHTTTPGSASRQFKFSYRVHNNTATNAKEDDKDGKDGKDDDPPSTTTLKKEEEEGAPPPPLPQLSQIIHQHANGLCIVTAGDVANLPPLEVMERIEFLVATADPCSAGKRRKQQSKMLRKGNNNKNNAASKYQDNSSGAPNDGVVAPDTILAKIHCRIDNTTSEMNDRTGTTSTTTTTIPIYAGVWGSLLELHTGMTPAQLVQDPLLNGYVAVILPTGPFPPKECLIVNTDGKEEQQKKKDTNGSDGDQE